MTSTAQPAPGEPNTAEIMITAIAALLEGLGHVAVGARSPIPGSAAHLARARSDGRLRVSILGSRTHSSFTDGARELFDCAGQGRIDAFFLSGGQIDGQANINLVGVGDVADYPRAQARFPGSFGSAYLYYVVPRVILFVLEHTPRTLVPKVDFISAPGTSPPEVYRPGGPHALVTSLCVFRFDRTRARFTLASTHPGVSRETVRAATGFDYDEPGLGAGDTRTGRRHIGPAPLRHRPHHRRHLSRVRRQDRGIASDGTSFSRLADGLRRPSGELVDPRHWCAQPVLRQVSGRRRSCDLVVPSRRNDFSCLSGPALDSSGRRAHRPKIGPGTSSRNRYGPASRSPPCSGAEC